MFHRRPKLPAVIPRKTGPRAGAQDPLRDRGRHFPLLAFSRHFFLFPELRRCAFHPAMERVERPLRAKGARDRRKTAAAHPRETSDAISVRNDLPGIGRGDEHRPRCDGGRRGWRVRPEQGMDVRLAL